MSGNATCTIKGCDKPLRSKHAEWCGMHYHRWYRHGDPLKTWSGDARVVSLGRRYRTIRADGHPMSHKNGRGYEHRIVLFDHLGEGPHACHWCDAWLNWTDIQVDHLDGDGSNNELVNLVPSCGPCNTGRGARLKMVANADSFWSGGGADAVLRTLGRSLEERDQQLRLVG